MLHRFFRGWTPATFIAVVSSLSLTVGGLLVFSFFVRTGFMPDVDLGGSTALLLAVALVGFGTVLASAVVAVLPGSVTWYVFNDNKLVFDRHAVLATVFPAALLYVATMLAAFFDTPSLPEWLNWIILVALALSAGFSTFKVYFADPSDGAEPWSRVVKVVQIICCGFFWLLGMLTALRIALVFASDGERSTWLILLMMTAWLALVVGLNAVMARLPTVRHVFLFAPFSGVISLVMLVVVTQSFTTLPLHVVSLLGYGDIKGVDLIVKPEVCQSLRLSSLTALRCAEGVPGASGALRNVTLRSRIGAQILVERETGSFASSDVKRQPRAVLRKEDVVMWILPGTK